jgi:hypothetical protein
MIDFKVKTRGKRSSQESIFIIELFLIDKPKINMLLISPKHFREIFLGVEFSKNKT